MNSGLPKIDSILASSTYNQVIPAPSCIPLFVDVGAKVILAGAFQTVLTDENNIYSSFPIIVSSAHYPNFYFSLMPKDQLKSNLKRLFPKQQIEYHDYTNFTFKIQNDNKKQAYFFGTDETNFITESSDLDPKIALICTNILNPLGIGAFYSINNPYLPLSQLPAKYYPSLNFEPALYSIEMVKKMFFEFKSEKFNDYSVSSLVILKYPLPAVTIPRPNLKEIGDRYIFFTFMLNNPPQYNPEPNSSFLFNFEELHPNQKLLSNIESFKFVHISAYTFEQTETPIEFEANLGDCNQPEIDIFLVNEKKSETEKYNICKKFNANNEVDIMSPDGGDLYITITQFPEELPKQIGFDVFIEPNIV